MSEEEQDAQSIDIELFYMNLVVEINNALSKPLVCLNVHITK